MIKYNFILEKNNIKNIENASLCKELWDINNGIVFCIDCHRLFHKIYGRINTNELQVKEFIK